MARIKKTETVSPQRVLTQARSSYNPLRNLTFESLSTQLDSFSAGYLSQAARTFQKIEERDDILISVAPKFRKSVARHGWEIITTEQSPAADAHKKALEDFYNSISVTSAVDLNYCGDVSLLVRQMLDAVGKKYSVHEIVWKPGAQISAEFRFVPLWFFENTTGRLRYLPTDGAVSGVDLQPGEWLVTAGDGLMIACSVAYLYKHLPLKDWLCYCDRSGTPGLRGITSAARGTTEWNNMVTALEDYANDFAAVMNESERIEAVNTEAKGELPFPKLIERMDRALAAIWRGADLSTMSAGATGAGQGASLQGGEADILEADAATLVTETLNERVDRYVIEYQLGDDQPLAWFHLKGANKRDLNLDMAVDTFLIDHGVSVSQADLRERYGRSAPDEGEELAVAAPKVAAPSQISDFRSQMGNERRLSNQADAASRDKLVAASQRLVGKALADDLAPIRDRMMAAMALPEPEMFAALESLRKDLPGLLLKMNAKSATAKAIEDALSAALLNGYIEGTKTRRTP